MEIYAWLGFLLFILALLALDLGVFHRQDRVISIREAIAWSAFWIVLALGFNALVYAFYGHHWLGFGTLYPGTLDGGEAAMQFFTGYLVEKSLSIDNIFVIAMIFAYFRVPLAYQHRVLFWGILGALVLRGLMIAAGATLFARFEWVVYVFGGLLLLTAVKLLVARHDNLQPDKNFFVRTLRRFMPVTEDFHGHSFFVRQAGKWALTPLGICLVVVESSDLLFAVDSIPAIFAITRDPFLVFTSNVFALLGLRSLYFALAGTIEHLRYLKTSLAFVLAFIGMKMILSHHHPIPNVVSLAMISGMLGVGILASIFGASRDTAPLRSPLAHELQDLTRIGLRQARRVVVLLAGSTVVLIGIVMIILPGPAFLVIPAGLSILAVEFVWARRWLNRMNEVVSKVSKEIRSHIRPKEEKPPSPAKLTPPDDHR